MTNLTVAFRNLAKTSKNSTWYSHCVNVLCMDIRNKKQRLFPRNNIERFFLYNRNGECLPRGTHWVLIYE